MLILSISNPIAQGKPLLLLPSCDLVRWPKGIELPTVGTPYRGAAITFTGEALARIRLVLFSPIALDRCDAAVDLPLHLLSQVYSYPQAKHLHHVARHLCPELRQHIKAGHAASLFRLLVVAYGETPAEQLKRWNQSLRSLASVPLRPRGGAGLRKSIIGP